MCCKSNFDSDPSCACGIKPNGTENQDEIIGGKEATVSFSEYFHLSSKHVKLFWQCFFLICWHYLAILTISLSNTSHTIWTILDNLDSFDSFDGF